MRTVYEFLAVGLRCEDLGVRSWSVETHLQALFRLRRDQQCSLCSTASLNTFFGFMQASMTTWLSSSSWDTIFSIKSLEALYHCLWPVTMIVNSSDANLNFLLFNYISMVLLTICFIWLFEDQVELVTLCSLPLSPLTHTHTNTQTYKHTLTGNQFIRYSIIQHAF